jgi:PAS domain S-box-containing protein
MHFSSPSTSPWKRFAPFWARYSVALVCLGLALLLVLFSDQIGAATPFLVAASFVALIAWYAGFAPGLLMAFGLALVLALYVVPPFDPPLNENKEVRLAIFLVFAGLIAVVLHRHRRAGEALRSSEERFRAAYQHAAVGLEQLTLDGRYAEVNPKLCEILGYTREELLLRHYSEFTHPEDLPAEEHHLAALLAGDVASYALEKRYLRKSGESVWVRLTASLAGDPGPGGNHRISVVEDISERKRAQDGQRFLLEVSSVLASSLDEATTLQQVAHLAVPRLADWCAVDVIRQDGSTQSVAIAHRDPTKIAWARKLRQRYTPDPAAPRGVLHVIRTGQPELYPVITDDLLVEAAADAEHLAILLQAGLSSAMILPLIARGRTLGAVSLIAAESGRRYGTEDLDLAGDVARRAAIAIDNSRLYHEVQGADRQKETFLAMLGHELRTPIGVIFNTVNILERRYAGDETVERLRSRIERQVVRMARLIDDMQDVTRINRGRIALERGELDLCRLVRETAEDQRSGLEEAGLRLVLQIPRQPFPVRGDATRLAQVVVNLLNNALKFTDPGGTVTVRLEEKEDGARVSICDTGIGIAPEMLPCIFESFTQGERSLDRSRGGLGLGLALVKGLIQLHGGDVNGSSPGVGHGAEFTFRLPHADAPRTDSSAGEPISAQACEEGLASTPSETATAITKET